MSRRKNQKNQKLFATLITFIFLFILVYFSNGTYQNAQLKNKISTDNSVENSILNNEITYKTNAKVEDTININNDKLNIIFLYVGQADCTFIKLNDKSMLIDAGNNEDGKNIVSYLQSLEINKINYVIGTHADEDHIGGLDDIINNIEVEKVYMPQKGKDETNYKNVVKSASNKNINIETPNINDEFNIEKAKCKVMSVMNYEGINDNNSSIVLQLSYENTKYLFMGDAEKEVENSRKWDKVDVLKVGHHGSNTGSTADFLNQVAPHYAIIEVGNNNKYKLPNSKAISRIESVGATILRTDTNCSSFMISSDGKEIEEKEININLDGNK